MLSLTNTLTRSVEPVPVPADRPLRMYACGPTVYRYAHLGNLRTFLLADLVRRALAYRGVAVRAVQNITDVGHLTDDQVDHSQDKMLVAAGLEGRSPAEIAEAYTRAYLDDAARLNLLPFDVWPRATEHIPEMIELTARLVDAGHAYDTDEAVYFDVRSFPAYGQLSGNDLEALRAGHRSGEIHAGKRFHGDFALWRKAGPHREVSWDSPWGRGFPGWHVECSAMALTHLGERVDLHLGGVDLVFPHHECEIAQSEAVLGHRWVDHWVHGEHLLTAGRKMAKSAGNFTDLRTLAERGHDPLAFRLLCLQARYRTQLTFTWEALAAAERTLQRLRARVQALRHAAGDAPGDPATVERLAARLEQRFVSAVESDLDTPAALVVVHEVAGGSGEAGGLPPSRRADLLVAWDAVLGLGLAPGDDRPQADGAHELPAGAAELLERRERARANRDYATADALRAELAALGVEVTDTPDGTRWALRPRAQR